MTGTKTAETRASKKQLNIVTDGDAVLALYEANKAAFTKADVGKKQKAIEPAMITRLAANLKKARKALGMQKAKKGAVRTATFNEEKARESLFTQLTSIRDDVKNSFGKNITLQKAFGAGKHWQAESTPSLTAAAQEMTASYADADNQKSAKAAGITPAKIAKVQKLHDALTGADTNQNVIIGTRRTLTKETQALLKSVEADVAQIRKVAKSVFKSAESVLASFKSTAPKHAVKKRAPKTTTTNSKST